MKNRLQELLPGKNELKLYMLLTLRLWNSNSGLDFRQCFLLHEYQMPLPQARHLRRRIKC